MDMEDITGRYLKQVRKSGWQVRDYIGSYFLITECGAEDCMRIKQIGETHSGAFSRDRLTTGEFELMPEGFVPKELQPKQLPIFN